MKKHLWGTQHVSLWHHLFFSTFPFAGLFNLHSHTTFWANSWARAFLELLALKREQWPYLGRIPACLSCWPQCFHAVINPADNVELRALFLRTHSTLPHILVAWHRPPPQSTLASWGRDSLFAGFSSFYWEIRFKSSRNVLGIKSAMNRLSPLNTNYNKEKTAIYIFSKALIQFSSQFCLSSQMAAINYIAYYIIIYS